MNRHLAGFFNKRYDQLIAQFKKVKGSSSATTGLVRESGVAAFLGEILPPFIRIERGDVVDSNEETSGQLDAVLLHQGVPSLKLVEKADPSAKMIAESVVAAIEVKSNLRKQWKEVRDTCKKLVPLWRPPPTVQFLVTPHFSSPRLPFVAIGLKGWKKPETVQLRAEELAALWPGGDAPMVMVLNLHPPMVAVAGAGQQPSSFRYKKSERGRMLCGTWAMLSESARVVAYRWVPWESYVNGRPGVAANQATE